MPTQTRSPGTVTETDDFGNGVESWSNENNVKISDNVSATVQAGNISFALRCENFGFTIPSGATINSITVEVEGRTTVNFAACVYQSELLKGGALTGNFGDVNILTDADAIWDVSPALDPLWGTTWTPAQINAIDFGVCVNVTKFVGEGN